MSKNSPKCCQKEESIHLLAARDVALHRLPAGYRLPEACRAVVAEGVLAAGVDAVGLWTQIHVSAQRSERSEELNCGLQRSPDDLAKP